jgi:hypothetical protein
LFVERGHEDGVEALHYLVWHDSTPLYADLAGCTMGVSVESFGPVSIEERNHQGTKVTKGFWG